MSQQIYLDNYDILQKTWRHKFVTDNGFYTILDDFLTFDLEKIVADPNEGQKRQNEKNLKDVAFWLTLIQSNIDSTELQNDKTKVINLYKKAY